MKKFVSWFVIIAMVISLFSLVGCGTSDKDTAASTAVSTTTASKAEPEATKEPEKVTVRLFTRWSDSSPSSVAFQEWVKDFMKQNPHITVDDQSINDEAAYVNKWKTAVATNDVPEVFQNFGGAENKEYVKNGIFSDLSADLDADVKWKDSFLNLFDAWKYNDISGIYGVPSQFYAVGLFYNKDLFQKIGSEPPKTISEFMAVSEKFKAQGIIPMAIGEKDVFKGAHLFTCLFLKKYGSDALTGFGTGKTKFDGPETLDILNVMSDMNKKGVFGQKIVSVDYNAEKGLFLNGKTAMHYDGSWFLSEAEASAIKDKIGVVSIPYFEEKPEFKDDWMGGAGAGFSISGKAEGALREAALMLIKSVTSVEHFKYVQKASKGGVYPVKLDSAASEVGPVTIEYTNAINASKKFTLEVGSFVAPQVGQKHRDAIQGMFAGNPPEKAAKEMADEAAKAK